MFKLLEHFTKIKDTHVFEFTDTHVFIMQYFYTQSSYLNEKFVFYFFHVVHCEIQIGNLCVKNVEDELWRQQYRIIVNNDKIV
jgi:hypothetical protein